MQLVSPTETVPSQPHPQTKVKLEEWILTSLQKAYFEVEIAFVIPMVMQK